MIKMIVVLTVISCVAALLLAVTNVKTKDLIADQQQAAQQEALKRIMPEGVTIVENTVPLPPANESLIYWTGTSESDTVYAFKISSRGYSSVINYMVSITAKGIISGMAVLEQNETPGLGSRIQEVLSNRYIWNGLFGPEEKSAPWFSEQFKGISINRQISIERSMGEWHGLDEKGRKSLKEENGITAITGSTISTRAVTNALTTKAQAYLKAIRG